jgi:alkanesulfonate monooxygenase SsuD/methylene tetrahydromethanopterin reductase-like flavin-dependent oxidoreductase (luciferase family)
MKLGLFDIVQWPGDESAAAYDPRVVSRAYAEHLDLWKAAEGLGFDYVFVGEHHFSGYSLCPDPYLVLAALARETSRIRLGAMVSVVPFHHPVRLAEQLAMIDVLSNGRLEAGFGRSSSVFEYGGLRLDMEEASERFQESVDFMREAWTAPEVRLDGRFHQAGPLAIWPRPLQQPHPPLWVAATSPATIQWAASRGVGIATGQGSPEQVGERFAGYRSAVVAAGYSETDACTMVLRTVFVADSDEEAQALIEPELDLFHQRWYRYVVRRDGLPVPASYRDHYAIYDRAFREGGVPKLEDQIAQGHAIVGSPETVIAGLRRVEAATGATAVLCNTYFGSYLTSEQTLRSMELLTREVMPALQAAGSTG